MLHAIIPAGGAGTRLWPLSRQNHPKFLLEPTIAGQPSLLSQTLTRLAPVAASYAIVSGQSHRDQISAQLQQLGPQLQAPVEILTEPSARQTMPAIGLAAAVIEHRYGPDALIGSFAADHLIRDEAGFVRALKAAIKAAENDKILTIGITPEYPSSGYGYILPATNYSGQPVTVERFSEKPDPQRAAQMIEAGAYWNAGMFIAKAGLLLDALALTLPKMAADLRQIGASATNPQQFTETVNSLWEQLPVIAIDHAVAEPAAAQGLVAVQPADVGWSDVGDFNQWSETCPSLPHTAVGSENTWVGGQSTQHVAIVGIPEAIVVTTADAVLVTTREHAQSIGQVSRCLPPDSPLR